jgi:hypothetical protein
MSLTASSRGCPFDIISYDNTFDDINTFDFFLPRSVEVCCE